MFNAEDGLNKHIVATHPDVHVFLYFTVKDFSSLTLWERWRDFHTYLKWLRRQYSGLIIWRNYWRDIEWLIRIKSFQWIPFVPSCNMSWTDWMAIPTKVSHRLRMQHRIYSHSTGRVGYITIQCKYTAYRKTSTTGTDKTQNFVCSASSCIRLLSRYFIQFFICSGSFWTRQ